MTLFAYPSRFGPRRKDALDPRLPERYLARYERLIAGRLDLQRDDVLRFATNFARRLEVPTRSPLGARRSEDTLVDIGVHMVISTLGAGRPRGTTRTMPPEVGGFVAAVR